MVIRSQLYGKFALLDISHGLRHDMDILILEIDKFRFNGYSSFSFGDRYAENAFSGFHGLHRGDVLFRREPERICIVFALLPDDGLDVNCIFAVIHELVHKSHRIRARTGIRAGCRFSGRLVACPEAAGCYSHGGEESHS